MEVGPSAAPMIPALMASFMSKPRRTAKTTVRKIPNCAAPPKRSIRGLESRGPKSIIAPMPMNSTRGNTSYTLIPFSNSQVMMPCSPTTPESGRLTRIAPKPMGSKRAGSKSFFTASQMSRPPITHMNTICPVTFWNPLIRNSNSLSKCYFSPFLFSIRPKSVRRTLRFAWTYIFAWRPGAAGRAASRKSRG